MISHNDVVLLLIIVLTAALYGVALGIELQDTSWQIPALCGLLAATLLAFTIVVRRNRQIWEVWASLFSRFVVISLPIVLLLACTLVVIAESTSWNEPIRQALIAAAVVAAGWIATFIFQEFRRETDRSEMRRDIQRSLRTEIELYYLDLHDVDWAAYRCIAETAFHDDKFIPLVPQRTKDRMMSVLLPRIEILTDVQIVPVMRYYDLTNRLERMSEDFRSTHYAAMSVERRKAMLLKYLDMEETSAAYAETAIRSLSSSMYFEHLTAQISKKGQDQSDRREEA